MDFEQLMDIEKAVDNEWQRQAENLKVIKVKQGADSHAAGITEGLLAAFSWFDAMLKCDYPSEFEDAVGSLDECING